MPKSQFPQIYVYIWWDVNRIGIKYNKFDRMGLLDWIIGWFIFSPNSDVAVVHSSQGSFFSFLRHIVQNAHICSKEMISVPDSLKNDDIWSDLIT